MLLGGSRIKYGTCFYYWIPGYDCRDAGGRATHDYRDIGGRVTPGAVTEEAKAEARYDELCKT